MPLTMYTTTWCGFCKNLKRQLGKAGIEITEVDIELPRDDGDVVAPALDESWVGVAGHWRISRSGLRYRMHSYRRR